MPLLEATNLHKTYTLGKVKVPVLRGVSISVNAGEIVAILGASGSGKSTLLHLLGGLDRHDAGDGAILVDGKRVDTFSSSELDNYRRRDIGFVFQFYHLLPELSVLQNVLIGAMIRDGLRYSATRGDATTHAMQLLDQVGLTHRLTHRPAELSGGERQRVAIARALINKPRVLLADEPTGNLDRETGAKILDMLMDLRRTLGHTMVVVTHDESTAARADRVLRITDGVMK